MFWVIVFVFLFFLGIIFLINYKKSPVLRPLATVIVIVNNKESCIEGILRNVIKIQRQMPFELVVIDNFSDDQTPMILMRLKKEFDFKYYRFREKMPSPDVSLIHASNKLVYYIDIDNFAEPRAVVWHIYNELARDKGMTLVP